MWIRGRDGARGRTECEVQTERKFEAERVPGEVGVRGLERVKVRYGACGRTECEVRTEVKCGMELMPSEDGVRGADRGNGLLYTSPSPRDS